MIWIDIMFIKIMNRQIKSNNKKIQRKFINTLHLNL
jgi:hypothetical protein